MKSQPTESSKTKILYVITQGGLWGGAQRYVFDLATSLADQFEITVAIGEPDVDKALQKKLSLIAYRLSAKDNQEAMNNNQRSGDNEQESRINVIQLKHLVRRFSPWHDILAIFELAKLYKTIKPNIVHLNSSKAGVIGSLAKLLLAICYWLFVPCSLSIVYTAHGWVFNEALSNLKKRLYLKLEKITARLKEKIIVLSETDKKTARESLALPENKLTLIPLGINQPTNQPKEELRQNFFPAYCLPPSFKINSYLIGVIANFYPTKGVDIFLRSLALAKDELPEARAIIMGDGPDRQLIETILKNYELGEMVFLVGFVPEANKYLPMFDIFVLPSKKEGVPYALLEAWWSKVPIIATRVGGIPSLITDHVNGLLVPSEDPQALAKAITYAHDHREEMTWMATREPKPGQPSFLLQPMLKKTTALYLELIQEQTAGN